MEGVLIFIGLVVGLNVVFCLLLGGAQAVAQTAVERVKREPYAKPKLMTLEEMKEAKPEWWEQPLKD